MKFIYNNQTSIDTKLKEYKYASKVRLISFHDDISQGESIGNIRGSDSRLLVLGIATGPAPTLERAFENTQNQKKGEGRIKYMNDVSTEIGGFNAVFFQKQTLIVKGRGYR